VLNIADNLFKREKLKLSKEDEDEFTHQKEIKELRKLSKLIDLERKRMEFMYIQNERNLTLEELSKKRQIEKDIIDLR